MRPAADRAFALYRLRAIGMLRYYAGQTTAIHGETVENSLPGEIFSYTLKEPVGVVGAIIPWNGPLTATIWKIGPAIATGCTGGLSRASLRPFCSPRTLRSPCQVDSGTNSSDTAQRKTCTMRRTRL